MKYESVDSVNSKNAATNHSFSEHRPDVTGVQKGKEQTGNSKNVYRPRLAFLRSKPNPADESCEPGTNTTSINGGLPVALAPVLSSHMNFAAERLPTISIPLH